MVHKAFAIYDSKAQSFFPPFMQANSGLAIRTFIDLLKEDNVVSKHPEDYILYEIGEWDYINGVFKTLDNKISLGSAQSYLPSNLTAKE